VKIRRKGDLLQGSEPKGSELEKEKEEKGNIDLSRRSGGRGPRSLSRKEGGKKLIYDLRDGGETVRAVRLISSSIAELGNKEALKIDLATRRT